MKIRLFINRFILILGILSGIPTLSFGQVGQGPDEEPILLLHAERLEHDPSVPDAQRLIGNVRFSHKGTLMFCDSAWLYTERNGIDAYGKVHIKQADTLDVYADSLYYDGKTQQAQLRNNIKLRDKSITLTTNNLDYDMEQDIGNYHGNGKIIMRESQNVLTSKEGYYLAKEKELFFKDSVVLRSPQYVMNSDTLRYQTETEVAYFFGPTTIVSDSSTIYCENGWYDTKNEKSQFQENAYIQTKEQKLQGDSLYYDRNRGFGEVFGNISMIDTVQRVIMSGDYAYYDEKKETSLITGNTMMTQVYDTDSLFMHADTMFSDVDTAGKRLILAYHHVKFYRDDLQGKCDSLVYAEVDSTFKMFTRPVLWSEDNQLTGDYVEIKSYDGKIERLTMLNNAFIISEQDTVDYNQIKGKKMTGYFVGNNLHKILVQGNGQTVYYAVEEKTDTTTGITSDKKIGVNDAICSDILIYVDTAGSAIQKISFLDQPTATLYPMDQLPPKALILDGFSWHIQHRPMSKRDIFIWVDDEPAIKPEENQ